MRLRALDPDGCCATVLVDGVKVKDCTEACEEENWAICLARGVDGQILHDKHGVYHTVHTGRVEIVIEGRTT